MADLVFELFSEEIPARMQAAAEAELGRKLTEALTGAELTPESVGTASTPRRLAVWATGIPTKQADRKDERRGPRVGAPEKAVAGFLKSAGLESVDQCEVRTLPKGEFYFAVVEQQGDRPLLPAHDRQA